MNDEDANAALTASLQEAQNTVRSYDTKAQIVGVGYIFAIGIILELGSRIPGQPPVNILTVCIGWLLIVFPIVLFGTVLYPTRQIAPVLGDRSSNAKRTLYVNTDYLVSVDRLLEDIEQSDFKVELAYETIKTSTLRELKRRRFLRALFVSLASFIVLFLGQILRSSGLLQ